MLKTSKNGSRDGSKERGKINIFEEDSQVLKQDSLLRIGFDNEEKSIAHQDSEITSTKSAKSNKPSALTYLNRNREQNESVKEYILNSRKILLSQISINDKVEETERLKEFIIMEEEKLEDAKKTFEEDCEKFNTYLEELDAKANEAADDVKKQTKIKNEK
jgi:hypothetical protein